MIIHLIGSMRQFDDDLIFMNEIKDSLQKSGATIAHDWMSAANSRKRRQSMQESDLDWQAIVQDNMDAIIKSDALVVEGSRFCYNQAYQTAIALQHKKPVLNLYRRELLEYTDWPDKRFVSGISDRNFHNVAYVNKASLSVVIEQFINDITPKTGDIKLNITLTSDAIRQLDKRASRTGHSKNGIIKNILEDALNN